jgi:RsiW-degrading membrane proteinase PrsW (M82 family)
MTDVRPAPVVRPSKPALWVVLPLLAAGGARMGYVGARFADTYPLATFTAVALFALLAVPFWLIVSELDFLEREPIPLLAVAFGWGGLVATAVSIPGSAALEDLVAKLGSPQLAADWGATLAAPTVEEIAKTLGVVAIALIARSQINSVLDGVVYGAMVGLGFQIVEDIVYAMGAVALAGQGDHVRPVVATFLLRGFLAGVWSHTLFGALAGVGIGYLVVRRDRPLRVRAGVATLAVLGAWASHVLWNSSLFSGLDGSGLALLAVLLVKGLPPLIGILWLVRRAHDREAAYYVGLLGELRDPTLITEGELDCLGSSARRASARRQAGFPAFRTVRRLQRAQAHLAVELSRSAAGGSDDAMRRRCAEVREQRRALAERGLAEAAAAPRTWRQTASTVATTLLAVAVVWVALSSLGGS